MAGFAVCGIAQDRVAVPTNQKALGACIEAACSAAEVCYRQRDSGVVTAVAEFDIADKSIMLPVGSVCVVGHLGELSILLRFPLPMIRRATMF
ncbi:MAG TPA: hypothetical protein PLX84_09150 [Acidiphilium sp.]|nr:hypothetical protein [Acidiphilium sp.]